MQILWRRINSFIARIESVALIMALAGMTLMTFTQVLLRNLFSTSVLWFDPAVRHLLLVTVFVGASLATHEKHHIHIDAVNKILKGQARHLTHAVTFLAAGVICALLFYGGVQFVRSTYAAGDRILGTFPSWIAQMVMPYGYMMMALRFFADTAAHVHKYRKRLPVEAEILAPAAAMFGATPKEKGSS